MTAVDICLNALLVVGVLASLANAKSYLVDARVRREMGFTYSVASQLFSLATLALWTWLAVLTAYWQIGALIALGFVMRYAVAVALREQEKTR